MDARLRGIVRASRIADIGYDIARLVSPMSPAVDVVRFDHPAPDDFGQKMWIEIDYRVPEFALPVGEGLEFASPMMTVTLASGWLFRAGATHWDDERETDLFLWFTQLIDATETIRLPRGLEVEDPPSSEEVDETYAYFKGESEMDGRDLVVTARAEVRRRQIPPAGYAGFKKAIDEAQDWGEGIYRAETGGER
jgi:hypothetical protein